MAGGTGLGWTVADTSTARMEKVVSRIGRPWNCENPKVFERPNSYGGRTELSYIQWRVREFIHSCRLRTLCVWGWQQHCSIDYVEVKACTIESSEHPQIRAFGCTHWIAINKTSLLCTQDTYKWSDLRLLFPLLYAEKGRLRNAVANRVPASRWVLKILGTSCDRLTHSVHCLT